MAKTLKIWNGRSYGYKYKRHHVYVAAYSRKQAAELVSMACFGEDFKNAVSPNEIKTYYSANAWGVHMADITPTEPCVYMKEENPTQSKPFRVI